MAIGWKEDFVGRLRDRDQLQSTLVPYFTAFEEAAHRAAVLDVNSQITSSSAERAEDNVSIELDKLTELNGLLSNQATSLNARLASTTKELLHAQERQRYMSEEKYMRTHAVEALHDEILALTLQLNLSEQRVSSLERRYEPS